MLTNLPPELYQVVLFQVDPIVICKHVPLFWYYQYLQVKYIHSAKIIQNILEENAIIWAEIYYIDFHICHHLPYIINSPVRRRISKTNRYEEILKKYHWRIRLAHDWQNNNIFTSI